MPNSLSLDEISFKEFVRRSPIPLAINSGGVDPRITFLNDRFISAFGYTLEDIPTVSAWSKLAYPDQAYRDKVFAEWSHNLQLAKAAQGMTEPAEYIIVCKNGTEKTVLISGSIVGESTLITFVDLTEIRLAEGEILKKLAIENAHQISQIVNFDPLTRLPNRDRASLLIEHAITLAKAGGSTALAALICVDIDYFKIVNETYGRSICDHVLKTIARRSEDLLRETDAVARLSGDEFLFILSDVPSQSWLEDFSVQLQRALTEPITLDDKTIKITVSLGSVLYPVHGSTAETLLLNAETALAHAKEQGRNVALMFRPGMKAAIDLYAELTKNLQRALENNEFVIHYQPQIDIETGSVSGVEALIRWATPENGLLYPDSFIPIAERSGLIVPIGAWVLQEACKTVRQWQLTGLPIESVSVNLSAIQFRRGDVAKLIAQVLKDTGLSPDSLVIELTESVLMHEEDLVMHAIEELRALGVKFSIDDFGTGFSSMTYLKRFKVDRLKIDKSFVMAMVKNEDDKSIVRYVINLATSLNIISIAEGVENEETLSLLMSLGCNQAQGYFLSKPVPASGIEDYFDESR